MTTEELTLVGQLAQRVQALQPRVNSLSEWRSVIVQGEIGLWDKEKLRKGLQYVQGMVAWLQQYPDIPTEMCPLALLESLVAQMTSASAALTLEALQKRN